METCKPVVSCVCPPSTAGGTYALCWHARCGKALPPCTTFIEGNRVWGCRLSADTTFHVTLVICTLPDL